MNTGTACNSSSIDNVGLPRPSAANGAEVRAPSASIVSAGGSAVVSISPDQCDMTQQSKRIASSQPSETYPWLVTLHGSCSIALIHFMLDHVLSRVVRRGVMMKHCGTRWAGGASSEVQTKP